MIFRSADKEYLPITGMVEFNKLSAKLIFGADRYKTLHLWLLVFINFCKSIFCGKASLLYDLPYCSLFKFENFDLVSFGALVVSWIIS